MEKRLLGKLVEGIGLPLTERALSSLPQLGVAPRTARGDDMTVSSSISSRQKEEEVAP